MPAILPADSPFRSHHWHARQSDLYTTSTNSTSNTITIILVVTGVVVVIILVVSVLRCASRVSSHVAPRPMVQVPPGSRGGPVVAEILANDQASAVARDEATRDIPATLSSSSAPSIHELDPSRAMDGPSQPVLPSVDENVRGSRTSLGADVERADERQRTVIIHEDGGRVSQVDTLSPIELPPPYASVPSA